MTLTTEMIRAGQAAAPQLSAVEIAAVWRAIFAAAPVAAQAQKCAEQHSEQCSQQPVSGAEGLPPFAERVIEKLARANECFSDGQGADIGRHWLDMLTQLGLLNRVQANPAMWEITAQGEDVLRGQAAQPQPSGNAGELPPFPNVQVPRVDADIDLMDIRRLAKWCESVAKDYARAALAAQASGQDREDAERLNWIRDTCCDLRSVTVTTCGDDADVCWAVIEHHMAKPHEREIGRSITDDPREAIDAARAAKEQ